ncbi:hypothetical protein HY389_01085 [Candidatus Daviesbacteria bacterium]|nr:hypothetical protein [Candidatus Daviesbacteria bacterium]
MAVETPLNTFTEPSTRNVQDIITLVADNYAPDRLKQLAEAQPLLFSSTFPKDLEELQKLLETTPILTQPWHIIFQKGFSELTSYLHLTIPLPPIRVRTTKGTFRLEQPPKGPQATLILEDRENDRSLIAHLESTNEQIAPANSLELISRIGENRLVSFKLSSHQAILCHNGNAPTLNTRSIIITRGGGLRGKEGYRQVGFDIP